MTFVEAADDDDRPGPRLQDHKQKEVLGFWRDGLEDGNY